MPSHQPILTAFRSRPSLHSKLSRGFSSAPQWQKAWTATDKAKQLNQQGLDDQERELKKESAEQQDGFDNQIDNAIGQHEELQARTPWHREGSDKPPAKRLRGASAMTKGSSSYYEC